MAPEPWQLGSERLAVARQRRCREAQALVGWLGGRPGAAGSRERRCAQRRIGALEIDELARTATGAGRRLELVRIEFELLRHLAAEPRPCTRSGSCCGRYWGFNAMGTRRRLGPLHKSGLRGRLYGTQGPVVAGSNPVAPTNELGMQRRA
jgi:DNA-binding response OmpR family regulator